MSNLGDNTRRRLEGTEFEYSTCTQTLADTQYKIVTLYRVGSNFPVMHIGSRDETDLRAAIEFWQNGGDISKLSVTDSRGN